MAYYVDLATIMNSVRNRAEIRDTFVTDSELQDYINDSCAALFDLLIVHEPMRFISRKDITIVAGTDMYSLPSDFYQLIGVDMAGALPTSDGYAVMNRFQWSERHDFFLVSNKWNTRYNIQNGKIVLFPSPQFSGSMRIEYTPTSKAVFQYASSTDTVDMVNGWNEWIVLDVCIKCLLKEESEVGGYLMQQKRVEERITSNAELDHTEPLCVVDKYRRSLDPRLYPYGYRRGWS